MGAISYYSRWAFREAQGTWRIRGENMRGGCKWEAEALVWRGTSKYEQMPEGKWLGPWWACRRLVWLEGAGKDRRNRWQRYGVPLALLRTEKVVEVSEWGSGQIWPVICPYRTAEARDGNNTDGREHAGPRPSFLLAVNCRSKKNPPKRWPRQASASCVSFLCKPA